MDDRRGIDDSPLRDLILQYNVSFKVLTDE